MPHIKNNDVRERKTEETISNGKENLKEKNLKKKNNFIWGGERILEKLINLRNERAWGKGENKNFTGHDSYF